MPISEDNRKNIANDYSVDDHAELKALKVRVDSNEKSVAEMKERMDKMDEKYDIMTEMVASIKVLSTQMSNIADSVREMKSEFSSDIRDIKQEQKIIGGKVDKLELHANSESSKDVSKKTIKIEIITGTIKGLVWLVILIVLLALFPHLKDIIMG